MSKPINKTGNLASATVIRRASGQVSFIFKNINEEQLGKIVSKYGAALERQYGIRFSPRHSDLAVMVPFADYILVRPLSANGKTATSIRAISVGETGAVKEAVKELVTIYNKESAVSSPAKEAVRVMKSQEEQINELLRVLQHITNLPDGVISSFKKQIDKKVYLIIDGESSKPYLYKSKCQSDYVIATNLMEGTSSMIKAARIARNDLGDTEGRVLNTVTKTFDLLPAQSLAVKQLIEGFKVKLQFEDGALYRHSSGKYTYLGVLQKDGKVLLMNLSKKGAISSLNNDPHNALSKGIVTKVT